MLTKLRNAIGIYFILAKHIEELLRVSTKDKHRLSPCVLNSSDKINFENVEKLVNPAVLSLLLEHVANSKDTAIF